MTERTIEHRVNAGVWRVERPGVYVVGGVPPSWQQAVLAVTLPFDDCWISHGTAARLWGLPHAPELDAIEALRPYGRYRRLDGVIAHRSRIITPADVGRRHGIPVTSLARTIVDCAGRLSAAQVGEMIDAAIRKRPGVLEAIRACFARLARGGRRRFRSLRAALARRIPGYDPGESDLELRALNALTAAGLPMPVQQLRIKLNGKKRRIDLSYPDYKVAMELLGWEYHGERGKWDADHARGNELVAIGWRLLQFTSAMSDEDMARWTADTIAVAAA